MEELASSLISVIIANGALEDFIEGNHPSPHKFLDKDQEQPNPQYSQWQRLNHLFMSKIYSSLPKSKPSQE